MSRDVSIAELFGEDPEEQKTEQISYGEILTDEERKLIQKSTREQRAWLRCYLDPTQPITFMHGTNSAMAAGHGCSSRKNFCAVGTRNLLKFRPIIKKWLDEIGLGEVELKSKLKQLLEARTTKIIKIKGAVNPDQLPPNVKIISTSGLIERDKAGGVDYGDGETILEVTMVDNAIQSDNVKTALKLYGLNAPEKKEISGPGGGPIPTISREMSQEEAADVYNKILGG